MRIVRTTVLVVSAVALACIVGGFDFVLRAQAPQSVNTWSSRGAMPNARTGAAAVVLSDGRTLIAGGRTADGTLTDTVIAFDPTTNEVTSVGRLLLPRFGHTATLMAGGRVLITGGTSDGAISNDVEAFSLATGESTLVAQLSQPRTGHAAAALSNGKVLIVGGRTVDSVVLQSAEIFDPETSTILPVAAVLQVPRADASATTLLDGRVLIVGGNDGTQDLASAELFDPTAESFSALDAGNHLSVARAGHTALLLPNNNAVLIAGGRSNGAEVGSADLFVPPVFPDPYTFGAGTFTVTGAMGSARSNALGGPDRTDGYAFVSGGGRSDAETYRFATIHTDKDDYAPDERAVITGSGWQAGEEVTLIFQEDPAVHDDYVLHVTADAAGNIFWDQWAPEQHDLNVRFYLTAMDSRSHVQMTFTDSQPGQVTLTPAAVTVLAGTNANVQVKVTKNGNTTACSIALSASYTGTAPVGTSFSFSGPNPATMTTADLASTLTIGTTNSGNPASQTQPGTYNFTVAARPGSNCQGNGNVATANGSLIVSATQAATTLTSAPATASYGGVTTLSAALTVSGSGVSGKTIGFTLNGNSVGTATTNASGVATLDNVSVAGIDAGTYPTAVGAAFGGDSSLLASNGTSSLTVTMVDAVVSVTGYSGVYDGNAHGATGSATGVNGEDLSNLLSLGSAFTDAPGGTAEWSFAGNGNYNATTGSAAITIAKADATIAVSGYTGIYDGDAHGATGTAKGVKGEDLSSLLNLGDSFTDVPGGVATWTFTGNINYNSTTNTVSIAISKANASITVDGYTGVYDGDAHGATGHATGAKGQDLTGLLNLGDAFTNVPGGTATWSFAGNNNYSSAGGTVVISIAKADASIAVNGYTGVYDGNAHGATGHATGVKGADLGGLLNLGASFTNVPGGTASWLFAGDANYNSANGTAAIVILKADQVIVWANPSPIVYGTALGSAQLNATLTRGDGTLTYSPEAGTVLPVGVQTLQVSASATTNYNPATMQVTLQVNPWYATGFYKPVASDASVVNTVKAGSTVPLKFNLYTSRVNGTELTSTENIAAFQVFPMTCGATAYEDPVDITTTGATSLRYDAVERQFVQNWQTPKGGGSCYMVAMTAKDGTSLVALFKTK